MKRLWKYFTHGSDPETVRSLGDLVAGICFIILILLSFAFGRITA